MSSPHPGFLLIGHGTRDAAGQEEFRHVAEALAKHFAGVPLAAAFLELAAPPIDVAVTRLAAEGVTELIAVPLLLFAAGHAKRDIPEAVHAAVKKYPGMTIRWTSPLACDRSLVALSALRFQQALQSLPAVPAEKVFLLLVGRGSRDANASADMARFCRLRWEETPVGWCIPCFASMTGPTLEQALELAAKSQLPRIVVQPHLLFAGELEARIAHQARQFGERLVDQEVVIVPSLGPHPLLIETLADRCRAAWSSGDLSPPMARRQEQGGGFLAAEFKRA